MEFNKTHMWREINETPGMIAALKTVNAKTLDAIAADVGAKGIRNIILAGRGTSNHALVYFKYAIEILSGMTAGLAAPSVVTLYEGKTNFSGNLIVGCSQSGYAADVLELVRRGNAQGAVTVAVTNDQDSPVAKEAKYHLYLSTAKEISVAATKTFSAQLYVLLQLAAKLSGDANLAAVSDGLPDKIAGYLAQADALTDGTAQYLGNMRDGFVLARGITYPIAFESALKLQETCYIRMRGYAMSDFYHGPMAMVDKGTHILIYAPACFVSGALAENMTADQKKCIDKMLSLGADVVLITDSPALKEYKDRVRLDFIQNDAGEFASMFAFALYAQSLACKLSCAVGNDPDNPKALNKVTVTR